MHCLAPARRAEIRTRAEAVLARYEVADVSVGLLDHICTGEGIALLEADLRDIRGALRREREGWRIYLNREDSPERHLFTLAQLLGHFVLHAGRGEVFINGDMVQDLAVAGDARAERQEATAFAADLLMPSRVVEAALAGETVSEHQVLGLAARCSVSPLAMALRMRDLGYRVPSLAG